MHPFLRLGAVIAALAASMAFAHAPQVHAQSQSRAAGSATILYRSSFGTTGLKGWHINGLWHAGTEGIVSFDGFFSGEILAPFSVVHLRNFRVEATIKAVVPAIRPSDQEVQAYGLDLRATRQKHGIRGGSFLSPPYAGPNLAWSNQRVGGNDVTLGPGFNAYRVDVHGNDYTLSINGVQIVQFPITRSSTGTRVGIWSDHRQIEVKDFTVTRLGGAVRLGKVPPMQTLSLGRSDIPPSLRTSEGHYLTLEELARGGYESIDSMRARGQFLSYEAYYDQAPSPPTLPEGLHVFMTAYTSLEAAQKALAEGVPGPDGGPEFDHWVVADMSGLGDGASVLSYDYESFTIIFISLRRGPFVVTLITLFAKGFVSHSEMVNQTTALARIVDRHIKALG
jgi:hypothetical protein